MKNWEKANIPRALACSHGFEEGGAMKRRQEWGKCIIDSPCLRYSTKMSTDKTIPNDAAVSPRPLMKFNKDPSRYQNSVSARKWHVYNAREIVFQSSKVHEVTMLTRWLCDPTMKRKNYASLLLIQKRKKKVREAPFLLGRKYNSQRDDFN